MTDFHGFSVFSAYHLDDIESKIMRPLPQMHHVTYGSAAGGETLPTIYGIDRPAKIQIATGLYLNEYQNIPLSRDQVQFIATADPDSAAEDLIALLFQMRFSLALSPHTRL